jgi:branched-chain amino acid aminotransferase
VPDAGTLQDRVLAVLQANRLEQSRVRITVGREILVTAEPLPDRSPWAQVITSRVPVNDRSPLARIKCTSYAENIILLEQAGRDEVIRPNLQGELCEGCISNVFFVKERRIHTPALGCGCLPGVMRAELMSRMPVVEGRWPLEVLQEADEIWLTNALSRVRAVEEIDGRSLGRDSPLFREVREMLESGSANP